MQHLTMQRFLSNVLFGMLPVLRLMTHREFDNELYMGVCWSDERTVLYVCRWRVLILDWELVDTSELRLSYYHEYNRHTDEFDFVYWPEGSMFNNPNANTTYGLTEF